jgi:hypothetical protein
MVMQTKDVMKKMRPAAFFYLQWLLVGREVLRCVCQPGDAKMDMFAELL